MPCSFDGGGQPSLMPGTISRDASRHDLPPLGDEFSQQLFILIIDHIHSVLTESTGLLFPSIEIHHDEFTLRIFYFGFSP